MNLCASCHLQRQRTAACLRAPLGVRSRSFGRGGRCAPPQAKEAADQVGRDSRGSRMLRAVHRAVDRGATLSAEPGMPVASERIQCSTFCCMVSSLASGHGPAAEQRGLSVRQPASMSQPCLPPLNCDLASILSVAPRTVVSLLQSLAHALEHGPAHTTPQRVRDPPFGSPEQRESGAAFASTRH